MRYRAPELLPSIEADIHDVFKPTLTTMSDVYSLGSVVLQVSVYNLVTLALGQALKSIG